VIVHPFRENDLLAPIPGTRFLSDAFGLMGCSFEDPVTSERVWVIDGVYAPIPGRAIGGLRVHLTDQKGFISFCNQRDLEVLLGLAKGGQYCPWTGEKYSYVNDEADGWIGLFVDDIDLADDLFARELNLRAQHQWGVLPETTISRRIHRADKNDVERHDILLWDADPVTGLGPDPSLDNLEYRWKRVEEERIRWEQL